MCFFDDAEEQDDFFLLVDQLFTSFCPKTDFFSSLFEAIPKGSLFLLLHLGLKMAHPPSYSSFFFF